MSRSLLLLATVALSGAAGAQDSALTRFLIANRHPIGLDEGRLEGRGGRLLVDEGKASRFFLVGEEHGVAQAPPLIAALLSELRPAGYNTFAIEVSPLQGERLQALTRTPRVREALDTLLSSWVTSVPFYSIAEERELLASAMTPQGSLRAMRIWGLDYDVSADRYYLRELERLVPPAGRAAVVRARALADSGFVLLATQGNPSRLFAWSATDSVFEALRAALGARPSPRARAIVDVFERTARINRLFIGGSGYESNLMRSAYLRENFLNALAAAERSGEQPRVFLKFGGSHMMRGWNYTHTLDIGTAAPIIAESRGEQTFHVLVLGGPGSKSARMNIVKLQYEPIGSAEVDEPSMAWIRPALADSGWSLFDMRAVRSAYLRQRNRQLTPVQDRFLMAYDAIVVLTGSSPATPRPMAPR